MAIVQTVQKGKVFLMDLCFLSIGLSSFFIHRVTNIYWQGQYYPLYYQLAVFGAAVLLPFLALKINRWSMPRLRGIDLLVFLYLSYNIANAVCRLGGFAHQNELYGQLAYLFVYLTARFTMTGRDNGARWLGYVSVLLLLNLLVAILQYFSIVRVDNPLFSVTGLFSNPGPFAGYLAVSLPAVLYILLQGKGLPWHKWVAGAITMLGILLLVWSKSRAGMVAACAGGASVLFFSFPDRIGAMVQQSKKWAIPLGVVVLALGWWLYALRTASVDGRFLIWKVSLNMIRESPLFGHGIGFFRSHYNVFQADYLCSSLATDAEKALAGQTYTAFNELLRIQVECGILGLLLFLALLRSCWKRFLALRKEYPVSIAVFSSLVAVLIFGLFSYPFDTLPINTLFYLSIATLAGLDAMPVVGSKWLTASTVLAIFVAMALTFQCARVASALHRWRRVQKLWSYNEAEAYSAYKKLYPLLKKHSSFMFNYGAELAKMHFYSEALDVLQECRAIYNSMYLYSQMAHCYEALGDFDEAERYYRLAGCIMPHALNPKYLLMNMYRESGQKEKALAAARDILATPVKIPTSQARLIREEAEKTGRD